MIELKSPAEIDKIAVTGRFVAEVLHEIGGRARPGVNLLDLEAHARTMLDTRGARSCYWDYSPSFGRGPFRNVICLSVNDAVLHGLPHDHVLADGDVLTMDLAVSIDGWVADAAVTTQVGTVDDEVSALIDSTRRALAAGIEKAVPQGRLGDISAAIGAVAHADGYRVNTDFGGHGLGRTMHEDPHIPNTGRAGRGIRLKSGMVLALEPWWGLGTDELVVDPDGWTLRLADGRVGAHTEHTVAITDEGPRILTGV
ncbi:methionine aminopeptidase Map [Gordonia polyisoprenivorans VH2]|uniref:Methionine aminopeptidase n=1 Tax=Gordonia polyisoprenivorans (strain DSM 44266 / VH2) TaxID=1112204 RepID=H6N0T0_GORPV|nr:type I methionyl aminopeptidase [Gordonia polyisoprenivorans]AFA73292.1 methionine aminopeptidase Map [Gordonia polyisoprenivorans VH2]